MKISRREAVLGLTASVSLGGCGKLLQGRAATPIVAAPPLGASSAEATWLNRTTFGVTPEMVAQVQKEGIRAATERALAASEAEPIPLQLAVRRLSIHQVDGAELQDEPYQSVKEQMNQELLLRATYSSNQLQERMVDFWSNHFNVDIRKADGYYRKPADDTRVIRDNALGNFKTMLLASAQSPAMLRYLDNSLSKKGHPNENFAREILELHTLGVHGGYTQKDIQEVARCFTGWTIENRFLHKRGSFRFDPDEHDSGEKRVLGQVIPAGGGVEEGERVIDILVAHPATAQFIATKLCRYFTGSDHESLIQQVAASFTQTKGEIKPMMRVILNSQEILAANVPKRPLDFIVSCLRVTGCLTTAQGLSQAVAGMGQPLFEWPMPNGYPVQAEAWTGSLLMRWNFVNQLVSGKVPGTQKPTIECGSQDMIARCLARDPHPDEALLKQVQRYQDSSATMLALCLASPEFQWR